MKKYSLDITPRVLELLGPNLYTNVYYVLSELIANSYDADATEVNIFIEDSSIVVEDNGKGMSYQNDEVSKFLKVGVESRTNEINSKTGLGRMKMGRKGIGKLAALSISNHVNVKTISNGEKSGFILTKDCGENGELEPIAEEDIDFITIDQNGTSVEMINPKGTIGSMKVIRKNLSKLFTISSENFLINIHKGDEHASVSDPLLEIAEDLCGVLIMGDTFAYIHDSVDFQGEDLSKKIDSHSSKIMLVNKDGIEKEYDLVIEGWIGIYRTTRGLKVGPSSLPANCVSLLANGKVGQMNVLPEIGKNKMNESYLVGQFSIDLFEKTELPDMALSNRQGYKSDDPRYEYVVNYLKDNVLDMAIDIRVKYAQLQRKKKELKELDKIRSKEVELRKRYAEFKENVSRSVSEVLSSKELTDNAIISDTINEEINKNVDIIGIKREVDDFKKKILISHCKKDKKIADLIYNVLLEAGFEKEDILYTSSSDQKSRIPLGMPIYDYLREFFVNSYSTEKMYVLFVTSNNMTSSWGAMSEVGASWITRSDHIIFNDCKASFQPLKPLSVDEQYVTFETKDGGKIVILEEDYDQFFEHIVNLCKLYEKSDYHKDDLKKSCDKYFGEISIEQYLN